VPVGGVLVAQFYLYSARVDEALITELYDETGPFRGVSVPGLLAWAAGAAAFFAAGSIGGSIPAFAASMLVYLIARRLTRPVVHSARNP
jgi:hypothetical protein